MDGPGTPQVWHEDGPLGRWVSAQWRPGALAHVVSLLWSFDGALNMARERVFPDGSVELIVHLGARYRSVLDDRHRDGYPTLCFTGLRMQPEVVQAPAGRTTVVGVRLTPLGAQALLRGAHTEACGLTLDLHDVLGPMARALADALADARGPLGQLRAAARWVAARLREAAPVDPAVRWVYEQIMATRGCAPIGTLCERAGVSPTKLPARFRALVGVTPKQFARIARFRHALALLGAPSASPLLADVAAQAGYVDQPHFNAEFRALAGMSPGAYLHALRYPNSASLAEAA
ncbi:MAG: helix-turn-helix domain-containing protein [Pseudomonadota bacterium]